MSDNIWRCLVAHRNKKNHLPHIQMSKMLIVRLKIMLRLSFLKISGVVYSVELINKPLHNKNLYYFHYQKLLTTWLKLISSVLKISFSTFKTFSCFYNVLILWVNSMKFMILSLTKKMLQIVFMTNQNESHTYSNTELFKGVHNGFKAFLKSWFKYHTLQCCSYHCV